MQPPLFLRVWQKPHLGLVCGQEKELSLLTLHIQCERFSEPQFPICKIRGWGGLGPYSFCVVYESMISDSAIPMF